MRDSLPTILHAIFTHIDHRVPFIRQQVQAMPFQILRSWTPGYDELPDRSAARIRASVQESNFEQEEEKLRWEESTLTVFPKNGDLRHSPGGPACSIRAIAFRSLQLF